MPDRARHDRNSAKFDQEPRRVVALRLRLRGTHGRAASTGQVYPFHPSAAMARAMSDQGGAAFDAFIDKWRLSAAAERANKDSFLNDLCAALGVPAPNPTTGNAKRDDYVFEKAVVVAGESGKTTKFIDLYKRGCFVLEAKQGSESTTGKLGTAKRDTPTWNVAMNAAFGQAIGYATALDEPPPFVIVADIGYCLDIWASFDGSTRYRPFPNAIGHRIHLKHIAQHADTLRTIFLDPLSLDPSKVAVEVTREVAVHLAALTKRLEKAGHAPQVVADFLMRCIFTMFAEDVGLLPEEVFTKALKERWIDSPRSFPAGVETLWRAMNEGSAFGFFGKLLHFNGGPFKSPAALPLDKEDLQVLLTAAKCSWNKVEPAIFGALFEGALEKKERHNLGAHFTPRPYVERLVRATIEEPIREDWTATQARIRTLASSSKIKEAKVETRSFMRRLSEIRVLDPACGSGNFLYVALDLLKSVEDEAFALLLALEGGQTELCLDAPEVTPKQFLGIETNPRAKAIAELVLWIGYLQWHFRTKHRGGKPREPVLEDYKNIDLRDAVLAYDATKPALDAHGKPLVRWNGETMKRHTVTKELVPDERFTTPILEYVNPRLPQWPVADYIVGNPPFIGNKRMRASLGDGYVEALRRVHSDVPETADFVMYWWNQAGRRVALNDTARAGLITTNSITQTFSRKLLDTHLTNGEISLAFAVPDHPWVDARDGAAVRIAMTVIQKGIRPGLLQTVTAETESSDGSADVVLRSTQGRISSALTVGAQPTQCRVLRSNSGLSFMGITLIGEGFRLTVSDVARLSSSRGLPKVVRPYVMGRDLAQKPERRWVIDFFGMSEDVARKEWGAFYQHALNRVKPERDQNPRKLYRDRWWIFGEPREGMRKATAGLKRFIVTARTARFRIFQMVKSDVLVDSNVVAIASDDFFVLGVLSSRVHTVWARASGATLEDRPHYTSSTTFEPFPFPDLATNERERIYSLAASIDDHRKSCIDRHPELTITAIYNVLEKLRQGESLSRTELVTHDAALGSVLKKLHDDLDQAALAAYGLRQDASDDQVLEHLVALNAERLAEEARGLTRWLRPDYQDVNPQPAKDTEAQASGPGVRKSAPPKGPGIATARSTKTAPKARRKTGEKR